MKHNFKTFKQAYGENLYVDAVIKEARRKKVVHFYDIFGNYVIVQKGARNL